MYKFGATGFPAGERMHSIGVASRRQVHPDFSLLTSLLTLHLRWVANSATSLLDDVIEYAKTHEDAKGALLAFQKEADQIYSGWKEKLG